MLEEKCFPLIRDLPKYVYFPVVIFFLASIPVFSDVPIEDPMKRVRRHLLIKDVDSAVKEAKYYIEKYPDSLELQTVYLEALCQKGEEVEAFEQFSSLWKKQQDKVDHRLVSEWLAWGVLSKGEESALPMVRLYSLLGAAFTQDARALPILLKELRGTNAFLRSLAVKLSLNYGDEPLQKELLRLLKEETVWFVRLEVIRAVGALRIKQTKKMLQDIVANPRTLAEEKASAILALVSMYDKVSKEELSQLLSSNRAGLRHLGSELIAHFNCNEEAFRLIPLLQDDSPDVRISAMSTLGLLRVSSLEGRPTLAYIQKNLDSTNPSIAITAGWLGTVLGYEEGKFILRKWVEQDVVGPKRLAAAAIGATGLLGASLASEVLKKEEDVYAKVNLAMGLIGQRKEVDLAADVLFAAFSSEDESLWMWEQEDCPLFRSLAPSTVGYVEQIPRYPQVVDQLTRLEILSYLSIIKHPKALEAVKGFLRNQDWGVTGVAAATLLQEGGEDALLLIEQLLIDPEEKIRIQAALILAMLGNDPKSTKVLMESYGKADRDMKIHILEALGHIKDPSVAPFLLDVLKEPFQSVRVVAASALIHYLYQ